VYEQFLIHRMQKYETRGVSHVYIVMHTWHSGVTRRVCHSATTRAGVIVGLPCMRAHSRVAHQRGMWRNNLTLVPSTDFVLATRGGLRHGVRQLGHVQKLCGHQRYTEHSPLGRQGYSRGTLSTHQRYIEHSPLGRQGYSRGTLSTHQRYTEHSPLGRQGYSRGTLSTHQRYTEHSLHRRQDRRGQLPQLSSSRGSCGSALCGCYFTRLCSPVDRCGAGMRQHILVSVALSAAEMSKSHPESQVG
jgi:hypothetical protein